MKVPKAVVWLLGLLLVLGCAESKKTEPPDSSGSEQDITVLPDEKEEVVAPDVKVDTARPPPTDCDIDADCDDHNICTYGICAGGKCEYEMPDGDPCDDWDACTLKDACLQGVCVGEALDCDDGIECTSDGCLEGECFSQPLDTGKCSLEIVLTTPKRASTLFASGAVEVKGQVVSPAGPVQSFKLNGSNLSIDSDGSFETAVSPKPGVNILDLVATDSFDRTDRSISSFLYADELHQVGSDIALVLMHNSSRAFLRTDVWDDDDVEDLDDVAAVAYTFINNLDVGKFIPSPLFAKGEGPSLLWCEWTVDLSNIDYELSDVDIKTMPGGVILSGTFVDLQVYVDAVAPWCLDAHGWVYADNIDFTAKMDIWVAAGKLHVEVTYINVEIAGVWVDMEGGAASLFDWLINWFTDSLADMVETELETYLPEEVVPMLVALLNSFLEQYVAFDVPPIPGTISPLPLILKTEPVEAELSMSGSAFGMSIGVGTKKLNAHSSPGTLKRGDCKGKESGSFSLPLSQKVEAAVSEDLINQLLFALWWGGHLNVTLQGDVLGEMIGFQGLEGLVVQLDPYLPPVYTSCTDSGNAEIQLGDLNVWTSFSLDSEEGEMEMFLSAKVEAEIVVCPNRWGTNSASA